MDFIKHIEENFFAVSRYWGSLNSSLTQNESICAMNTGVTISDINWVWNEKPLGKDDAKFIPVIKEYYKKLNLRFWWWVYPSGQSSETQSILEDEGLRLIEKIPCMAADLNDSLSGRHFPDNIKISEVKNKNDLRIWEAISFHGFEMPLRAKEQYGAFVSSFELGAQSPQKLFIAYLDGVPAAASLLFTFKNSAGIYYVSTLPASRNKGCGMRITQAAMQSAKESGFKDVTLQATPQGAKIYLRAGFKEYCHAEVYKL
ncbi:MAG TPA: GNAT family N-acetyltransferase [Smithella sp.]|nr:GNAT family N-acetyltransferase [Smithella sp.]